MVTDPFTNAERRVELNTLANLWQGGALCPAEYTAFYFLLWQIGLWDKRFATRKNKSGLRPAVDAWQQLIAMARDTRAQALIEYFQTYQFFQVRANAVTAIIEWLRGSYTLELYNDIPSTYCVLDMQTRGIRPVTLMCQYPRLVQPVQEKANAYYFMLHDLEHAYKFFHNKDSHEDQILLARLWQSALEEGLFADYLRDPIFLQRFSYLISDMNTHPAHALYYLHANIIEFFMRIHGLNTSETLSTATRIEISAWYQRLEKIASFAPQKIAIIESLRQCLQLDGEHQRVCLSRY